MQPITNPAVYMATVREFLAQFNDGFITNNELIAKIDAITSKV